MDPKVETWKEFKECIERQGVTDDSVIDYIDWSGNGGSPSPEVGLDKKNGTFSVF